MGESQEIKPWCWCETCGSWWPIGTAHFEIVKRPRRVHYEAPNA